MIPLEIRPWRWITVLIVAMPAVLVADMPAMAADIVTGFQETEESFPNPGQGWMTMRRLPGDHSADAILPVPENLPTGQYTLGIALVDPSSAKPAIHLAIAAPQSHRLYRVGSISVE